MSVQLKTLVCQINIENGNFKSENDEKFAKHLYDRHSLQSMLETTGEVMRDKKWTEVCDKYISIVTVLIKYAPGQWISTFIDGFNDQDTFALCVRSLKTVCRFAEPKSLAGREYHFYNASDFIGVGEKACIVMNLLQMLLKKQTEVGKENEELDHWRSLLQTCFFCILVLSQHAKTYLWTNEKSKHLSNDCISSLMEVFCCSTMCQLLILDTKYVSPILESDVEYKSGVKKSIYGKLLIEWKPFLQRIMWKQNPVVCASFRWCLLQMAFPYLSEFIELILPPTLLFMDDHELENKKNGTTCLMHIIKNTSNEELRWYGRAEVIYSALKHQLVSTEEDLLPLTHEALFLTLKILEKTPNDISASANTKYDEVFKTVLQSASHENKLALRRVHTQPIPQFIEVLGISSVKYSSLLVQLFEEYLDISDAPTEQARLNTMEAVEIFIRVAYPRIPFHMGSLVKILVKLMHSLTSKSSITQGTVKEELLQKSVHCMNLLKVVDVTLFRETIVGLSTLPFNKELLQMLDELL